MAGQHLYLEDVQERLAAEAARIDASHGGIHRFNNIRRYAGPGGSNWTANYGVRAGTANLRGAVLLTEMRDSLRRVQAEMPIIMFEARDGPPLVERSKSAAQPGAEGSAA